MKEISSWNSRDAYKLTVTNIVKTGYMFDPTNSVLARSITNDNRQHPGGCGDRGENLKEGEEVRP